MRHCDCTWQKEDQKNSDVTNIGKVGMLFNITGTATDDGGFLSIEQKGLFLTICK